ncbi:MAG: hypothetical protein J0L87_12815 [Bacteroidetes bacterium]|nr:hypothetical protein [Bacteroidota bacterium]
MNGIDVINQIENERKGRVIIRWSKDGSHNTNTPISIKSECWGVVITDSPDEYFEAQNNIYKKLATHCTKIKINSYEEGIRLVDEINRYYNEEEKISPPVKSVFDPLNTLYLAIHIHYHIA